MFSYENVWLGTVSSFRCGNNDWQLEYKAMKIKLEKGILGGKNATQDRVKGSLWAQFLKGFSDYREWQGMSLFTPNNHDGPYLWKQISKWDSKLLWFHKKLLYSSTYSFIYLFICSFISFTHFTKMQAW